MSGILTRIGDALVIPRNQHENIHIIQEILVQEKPNNNNNNPENEVNVPTRLTDDRELINPILVNRNHNTDEDLANM